MSLILPAIRALLYNHKSFGWRNLGFVSTASTRPATGWTDAARFGGSNYGEYQFADGWIRGQGMTGAERIKLAGELSGITLLHADETDYTSASNVNLTYEWTVPAVHPDALDRAIRDALEEIYAQWNEVLTPWLNGNFNDGATGWIAGSSAPATIAATASASYNQAGQQSLLVTNNSVNDFATAQTTLKVAPGQTYRLGAIAHAVVGKGRFRVYNMTPVTPVQIGESMDTVGYVRTRMMQDFTVPAGCHEINCRLEGVEADASVVWDFLPGFRKGATLFDLESRIDARFKLPDVANAVYREGFQDVNYARAADNRTFERWKTPGDYRLENEGAAATPNQLIIDRYSGMRGADEIWLMGRRPWSEIDDLSDDTAATDAPPALLLPACIVKVADLLYANTNDGQWLGVRAEYEPILQAHRNARTETKPLVRRQALGGRVGP
jgi:hypothetical protein